MDLDVSLTLPPAELDSQSPDPEGDLWDLQELFCLLLPHVVPLPHRVYLIMLAIGVGLDHHLPLLRLLLHDELSALVNLDASPVLCVEHNIVSTLFSHTGLLIFKTWIIRSY
jgi:hypothetical protein